ncbi:MAG: hypothetical protein JO325_05465, partial [Solirubrobacterales bacterium]|nr:hypothetical protein [Solirubrobacterales bacterium]
ERPAPLFREFVGAALAYAAPREAAVTPGEDGAPRERATGDGSEAAAPAAAR